MIPDWGATGGGSEPPVLMPAESTRESPQPDVIGEDTGSPERLPVAPDSTPSPPSDDSNLAFTADEQRGVLEYLLRGASALIACRQLGLTVARYWLTQRCDPGFAACIQEINDTLSDNVAAALYKTAIEGNVSAQQFWLRKRPAPAWDVSRKPVSADDLQELKEDQLDEAARQILRDCETALAPRTPPAQGGPASRAVPPDGAPGA